MSMEMKVINDGKNSENSRMPKLAKGDIYVAGQLRGYCFSKHCQETG